MESWITGLTFSLSLHNAFWFVILYMGSDFIISALFMKDKKIGQKLSFHPIEEKNKYLFKFFHAEFFVIIAFLLFTQIALNTAWFWVGSGIFILSLITYLKAKYDYISTPEDKPVTKGVYRISRNPLYFFTNTAFLGVAIACTSFIILFLVIIQFIGSHILIKNEESYCLKRYGNSYREYLENTPRYFLFF